MEYGSFSSLGNIGPLTFLGFSTISKDERDSNRVKNEAKSPSEPEIITIDDLTSAEFLADVSEISAEDWFNNQLVIDPPANGVFLGDLTIGEKSANSAASQSAEVMESPSSSKEPRVFSRCFRKSDQNESEGLLDTEKMLPHLNHTPLNESARVFDGDSSFPYRTGMFESSAAESEEESHICEQNLDTNRRLWVAPSLSCDGQTAKTAEKILPRITPCLVRIEALTTAQLEEFGLTNLISSRGRSCTSAHSELPCVGVDSKGEPAASCGPLKKYPLRSRNRGDLSPLSYIIFILYFVINLLRNVIKYLFR